MLNRLTEVVKNILIINILLFILTSATGHQYLLGFDLAAYYPQSAHFRPYQIITHMFMHANLGHIFFNMYGLVLLGPPLEARLGSKRFLFFYFFAGLGSIALYYIVKYLEIGSGVPISINSPLVGASGAIFGVLAGFGTLFPTVRLQLLFPPVSLTAKWFVLIYAGIELYLGLNGIQQGVAHFAHIGGALFGFLLLMYWRKTSGLV